MKYVYTNQSINIRFDFTSSASTTSYPLWQKAIGVTNVTGTTTHHNTHTSLDVKKK